MMRVTNFAEPVDSAFRYLVPCGCRQGPALWNDYGWVFFACDCKREGPKVPQGKGAAIRACQGWNELQERHEEIEA